VNLPPSPAWPPRGWLRARTSVAADHPVFDGHFPGRPLLPGVGQLWLAANLADSQYLGAVLCGLRRVKFRSPIGPDTPLGIDLFPTPVEGELQLELRQHQGHADADAEAVPGELLAEGFLLLAPRRTDAEPPPAPSPPAGARPKQPPIDTMLPHRDGALFLTAARALGSSAAAPAWFEGQVPERNFLVQNRRASCLAAIEFAAQAAACLDTLRNHPTAPPRQLEGMLVAIREATFHRPDFEVAAVLTARLTTSMRGPFVNVSATIAAGSRALCSAELQIVVR
jgi:predicted hotdog family 3-hydroxylacyl-ACP dehydratase